MTRPNIYCMKKWAIPSFENVIIHISNILNINYKQCVSIFDTCVYILML